MYVLSATEAISPAIDRTRRILFRPFRWSTFLKLCAVAVLTEGYSGNSKFGHRSGTAPAHISPMDPGHPLSSLPPEWIAGLIAIAVVSLVLGFVIFYLVVRLRFALFHSLIQQTVSIKEGWNLYRTQARRFFQFNIMVGIAFLIVAAAAVLPFVRRGIELFRHSQETGQPDFTSWIGLVLQALPVILLLILVGVAADIVLRDFMLPHIALEDAPVVEAWEAAWKRIAAEKGAFLLYAILRLLLPIAAVILLAIVLAIPMILIFAVPGLLLAGLHASLQNASGAGLFMGGFLEFLLGTLLFAMGLFVAIVFGGPLSIGMRYYALLFYGGRYQPLGEILDAQSPLTGPNILPA